MGGNLPWYMVDVPLLTCPDAPGVFQVAIDGDGIVGEDRHEEWMVTFFRSTAKPVQLKFDAFDSGSPRISITKDLVVNLIDWDEKMASRRLDSDARPREAPADSWTAPFRSLGGIKLPKFSGPKLRPAPHGGADALGSGFRIGAGTWGVLAVATVMTRFDNGEYTQEDYGYTGRPVVVTSEVALVMNTSEVADSARFQLSRFNTWSDSYPAECTTAGDRKADCKSCNATQCSIKFEPKGILCRDEIMKARFKPSDVTWPLMVNISYLDGDQLTPDRVCTARDEPWAHQDMFIRLSKVGAVEPSGDVEFQHAMKESHGMGLVFILVCFCIMACSTGVCLTGAWMHYKKHHSYNRAGGEESGQSDMD